MERTGLLNEPFISSLCFMLFYIPSCHHLLIWTISFIVHLLLIFFHSNVTFYFICFWGTEEGCRQSFVLVRFYKVLWRFPFPFAFLTFIYDLFIIILLPFFLPLIHDLILFRIKKRRARNAHAEEGNSFFMPKGDRPCTCGHNPALFVMGIVVWPDLYAHDCLY